MRRVVFALLLASASLAAADLIQTDTYKCDPAACKLPACLCPANNPPGGLSPDEIPQFVLIGHDNALDTQPFNMMMLAVENKTQANGCNVPVTWFAQFYHSDCDAGYRALARGDEVAMQTNRFPPTEPFTATDPAPKYDSRDPKTGQPSVAVEINMSRKHWNTEYCKVNLTDMVGYRSIAYYNNPPIRKALFDNGYLYDATLIERWYPNSPTSPSASKMLWPYTMDFGIPQECAFMGQDAKGLAIGRCDPKERYPGLWEVPLYQLQDDAGTLYGVGNYGEVEEGMPAIADMEKFLKGQLDTRLKNGRVPLNINAHYGWTSDRTRKVDPTCDNAGCEYYPSKNIPALAKFIDYALTKPEVRFVTFSDLIAWMQDPVPLSQFDDWWKCKVPGVKANLAAVNLPEAEKEKQQGLNGLAVEVPAPAPAPVEAPTTTADAPSTSTDSAAEAPAATAPSTEQDKGTTAGEEAKAPAASAPTPAPAGNGASSLHKAVAAVAAVVGAMMLAL